MLTGYIVIGGVSALAIGAVISEKQLAEQDKVSQAKIINVTLNKVFPIGCIGAAVYVVWDAIQLFL